MAADRFYVVKLGTGGYHVFGPMPAPPLKLDGKPVEVISTHHSAETAIQARKEHKEPK